MTRSSGSTAGGGKRRLETARVRAFTLMELVVVMGIIGILAAMLLPALGRAKDQARKAACLNNLRQLGVCWQLYIVDNNDALPPNNFVYNIVDHQPLILGDSWCTNVAPFDTDPGGITFGKLYRYNQQMSIYRCPADKSTVEKFDGTPLGTPRLRSYNMSQSINGDPGFSWIYSDIPCFSKFTQIRNPGPSQCFVFLEVHEDEITDTEFGIPVSSMVWDWGYWWDIPANRHNQGANFSFADGHVEYWHWKTPKIPVYPRGYIQPVPPEEMPDYNRVQAGFLQSFD